MLWSLSSVEAESYFKCWNTCVKLVHGIPRSSYTYLVEGHFAAGQASLRSQVMSRYPGFVRGLLQSPSKEVRVLARIVETDPRSTTCLNLRYMSQITGLNKPEYYSSAKIREALPPKMVPDSEKWRIGLINNLIKLKHERYHQVKDFKQICAMVDSLCST